MQIMYFMLNDALVFICKIRNCSAEIMINTFASVHEMYHELYASEIVAGVSSSISPVSSNMHSILSGIYMYLSSYLYIPK